MSSDFETLVEASADFSLPISDTISSSSILVYLRDVSIESLDLIPGYIIFSELLTATLSVARSGDEPLHLLEKDEEGYTLGDGRSGGGDFTVLPLAVVPVIFCGVTGCH